MIRLKKIPVDNLKEYIRLGFEEDPDLISKYHISPGTLEHCVDFNYERIKDAEQYNGEFFKVMKDNVDIGFVLAVKEPNMILSFGINIHHRKRKTLLEWLFALKRHFGYQRFMVALWPKNIRAIRFFVRNNFVFSITEDKMVMLWQ